MTTEMNVHWNLFIGQFYKSVVFDAWGINTVGSSNYYIYILTVIYYDKTVDLVAVHFSVQNSDLDSALERGYASSTCNGYLFMYVCIRLVTYLHNVKCEKFAAGLFQDLC